MATSSISKTKRPPPPPPKPPSESDKKATESLKKLDDKTPPDMPPKKPLDETPENTQNNKTPSTTPTANDKTPSTTLTVDTKTPSAPGTTPPTNDTTKEPLLIDVDKPVSLAAKPNSEEEKEPTDDPIVDDVLNTPFPRGEPIIRKGPDNEFGVPGEVSIGVEIDNSVSPEDKKVILGLHGDYAGDMGNWKDALDSAATFYATKDFEDIEAKDSEVDFVNEVGEFFKEIQDEGERFNNLTANMDGYKAHADFAYERLNRLTEKYSHEQIQEVLAEDPRVNNMIDKSIKGAIDSVDVLADAATKYSERVNQKAEDLLVKWDQTKDNEKTKAAFDAITTVLGMVGGMSFAGPGFHNLVTRTYKKTLDDVMSVIPQAGGLVFGTGSFNSLLQTYVPKWTKDKADLEQAAATSSGKLGELRERFNKYVQEYNEEGEKFNPDPIFV